jgi:hypothetical protein
MGDMRIDTYDYICPVALAPTYRLLNRGPTVLISSAVTANKTLWQQSLGMAQ